MITSNTATSSLPIEYWMILRRASNTSRVEHRISNYTTSRTAWGWYGFYLPIVGSPEERHLSHSHLWEYPYLPMYTVHAVLPWGYCRYHRTRQGSYRTLGTATSTVDWFGVSLLPYRVSGSSVCRETRIWRKRLSAYHSRRVNTY